MLHLQRASAGSGKTFSLTKTFIRLFISRKKGNRRFLRDKRELHNSLGRILAVTFTNKATNEMKQRIVDELAALAASCQDPTVKSPYRDGFIEEFHTNPKELGEVAEAALKILLLNYSDFRVSTIDSFFQSILHTFTYEANMEDSFNLEIDGEYMASVGLDSLLDDFLNEGARDAETHYWLQKLMNDNREGSNWNIFRKEKKDNALYSKLIESLTKLDKEDFKIYTEASLDSYFNNLQRPFREIYEDVDKSFNERIARLADSRQKTAVALEKAYEENGIPEDKRAEGQRGIGRIDKAKKPYKAGEPVETFSYYPRNPEKKGLSLGSGFSNKVKESPGVKELDNKFMEFVNSNLELNEFLKGKEYTTWKSYRKLLPYLYLIHLADKKKKAILQDLNTVQISDTNTLLSKIIGEDEVPFIYERIGTQINHYLIDEFQDTSAMQWHNFLPLLNESEARDRDNLIIGDAKQSIYRFRNAEYKLITEEVEKQFGRNMILTADDVMPDPEKINTNWRSDRRIVEFNNYLFYFLTQQADNPQLKGRIFDFKPPVPTIYSDCIQTPAKKEERGYVNIRIYEPSKKKGENDDVEDSLETAAPGYERLGDLINSLLSRGYKNKDIAILVRVHTSGDEAVNSLIRYNAENPDKVIKFTSEESLKIASAPPVQLLVHLLELVLDGIDDGSDEDEENPGYDRNDSLVANSLIDTDRLFDIVNNMKSMALPSLIEALIAGFVPEADRKSYSAHIAAFQDVVLEYCSSYAADIGSFLQWWYKKESKLAIFSSEESDSVRITTVHKSKGLEYKCVIMPDADYKFKPKTRHQEWVWVENKLTDFPDLPPVLPVSTGKELADSMHADVWEAHCFDAALDSLNAIYVAFTRAKNELYVYMPRGGTDTLGGNLTSLLEDSKALAQSVDKKFIIRDPYVKSRIEEGADTEVFEYGEMLSDDEIKEIYKNEPLSRDDIEITEYAVTLLSRQPKFTDSRLSSEQLFSPEDSREAEDEDDLASRSNPLSEGVAMHEILSKVEKADDLDRALLKLRTRGLISLADEEKYRAILSEALTRKEIVERGWFDGSCEVLNERSILQNGRSYRPDRVMITPEGNAVIVDYKFGYKEDVGEYYRQVKHYMDLLKKTGLFPRVEGYLWYVRQNRIQPVD